MDEELLRLLVSDFDRGFECLVLAYQHRIFAFGRNLAGNSQDGEEVAQDAFVRAHRALLGYPAERLGELKLGGWLFAIALNVFRNRLRRRQLVTVAMEAQALAGEAGQPEAALEAQERSRRLLEVLSLLPLRHREAVVLRHVQGLSYGEAAAALGQPVGTVKANVHRGLAHLRRLLAADGGSL